MDKPIKEVKPKQTESEMITIPASDLEDIKKMLSDLRRDNDMLLQVADKKQMSAFYQRNKGKIPTRVQLRIYDGKVVLGWQSTTDIPPQIDPATGRWNAEVQKCRLVFEDGSTSEEMYQVQFTRNYKQAEAEVVSKIVDEVTGNVALKVVRLDNGKEYTLGKSFIN